jgi:hypothetical protein
MHAVNASLKWFLLLLIGFGLSGCAGLSNRSDDARHYWRGTLIQDAQGYWFELCGEAERHPVVRLGAPLEREYARHSLGEGWPVYVEVLGQVSEDGVTLDDPVLIGGSLQACELHLPGIKLRAVSERDNAVFDLREQHIRVHFRDSLRQFGFTRPEVERLAAVRRWQQTMKTGGGRRDHNLSLEVEKRGCEDTRGGWYALTLSAELDGRLYTGCARLGDLEHWRLSNRYQTPDSLTTRRLTLQLEPDGRAVLLEDYLNQQPVIEHQGRWQQTGSGRLRLEFMPQGGFAAPQSLTFGLSLEGRLRLNHFHPAYGRELELLPTGERLMQHPELDWWR